MRRLIAFLLPFLFLASPLLATEPNPSAHQRELIEKLMEVTKTNQTTARIVDAMLGQWQKQALEAAAAKGNHPDDIAEAKEEFESFRQKLTSLDFATMMKGTYIRLYSKYFTEKELEDLVAFYDTPTGQKSIEVMGALSRDAMESVARDFEPKMAEIERQVEAEKEKKYPWRRTMSDMRSITTALDAYAIDHDERYPSGDYEGLGAALVPTYVKKMPAKDVWGHAYAYVVSPDQKHYRVVSAGADTIFEWDSRKIDVAAVKAALEADEEPSVVYKERLEDDIIMSDLGYVQVPTVSKPREK